MTPRTRAIALLVIVGLIASGAAAWVTVAARRRSAAVTPAPVTIAPPAPRPVAARKINARLFYVSADGTTLTGVDREVAYADGASAQAQEIITAQLAAPPAGTTAPGVSPLVSAIPPGTTLRAVYLNDKGEAYVDLSKEVSTAHTGGSQDELLTIYSIVNALTANLPAVTSVQLLVDGKEVDTLAGHIDLRKPLGKNTDIISP